MERYFHLTTPESWEAARAVGHYQAESLATEGFIHLSLEHQWPGVRQRYYAQVPSLVLLELAGERLTAPVRLEAPPQGDELFPHLYGPLNLDAVVSVRPL